MPIAVTTEQLAIAESVGQWAKRAGTIAAVRDLETRGGRTGGGGDLWAGLAELGIFSIALPAELGGGGGTAADVAVVAETLAASLAPGPVLPTLLAGLVLARSAGSGDAHADLIGRIATGAVSFGAAMWPLGLTGAAQDDGGLLVSGTASLVLGAGDASHLLLGGGYGLRPGVVPARPGPARRAPDPADAGGLLPRARRRAPGRRRGQRPAGA